jgi:hypothetical protein
MAVNLIAAAPLFLTGHIKIARCPMAWVKPTAYVVVEAKALSKTYRILTSPLIFSRISSFTGVAVSGMGCLRQCVS